VAFTSECRLEGPTHHVANRREWLWLKRRRRRTCCRGRLDPQSWRLGSSRPRHDYNRTAFSFRFIDQTIHHPQPLTPVRGCCPGIVDDNGDRPCALQCRLAIWVKHRFGEREDYQRGGQQPDEHQPPGSLGRRALLVPEAEQDARRGEQNLPG